MSRSQELLKHYFGHEEFRPGQEQLIEALLTGRDVLGVMPTGAGKSVCYQIPALLLPGLSLVISPLISLMKDQVTALTQAGIAAAFLNSSQSYEEYGEVLRRAGRNAYKILYVSPERLETPDFLRFAQRAPISLIAVDEAHCVSQWGQDFRPSYLKIALFVERLPARPVVGAFTATATEEVKADIRRLLALRDPLCVTTGFDRPNLFFDVQRPKTKEQWLLDYLVTHPDRSGIVYCATRKKVESVCDTLQKRGISATRYHAGLEDEERRRNQEDFVYDRARVMVATNAFGMGIDKSNVSFVIHFNMPKNMESYYQEAGRAGRDGAPADCVLLFSAGDVQTARFLIENSAENEALSEEAQALVREGDLHKLREMTDYCKTTSCFRARMLRYFGEDAPPRCGNCGNCVGDMARQDITLEAQKILSGVARVERRYRTGLGITQIVRMLHGSREQRILELGLDKLPTYGILSGMKRTEIRALMDVLLEQGYLYLTEGEYPVLRLTKQAADVLFQGKRVFRTIRKPAVSPRAREPGKAPLPGDGLYEALRATRTSLARAEGVPAYIVLSNAALADMAARRPHTAAELLQVSGIGEIKAERYGTAFLEAVSQWEKEHR